MFSKIPLDVIDQSVFLKIEHTLESPGWLVTAQVSGPLAQSFWFSKCELEPENWHFSKFPGAAEAGSTLWEPLETETGDSRCKARYKLTVLRFVSWILSASSWVCSVGKGSWQQTHSRLRGALRPCPNSCLWHLHSRTEHSVHFRRDSILVWILNILRTKYSIFTKKHKNKKRKDFKLMSVADLRTEVLWLLILNSFLS